MKLSKIKTFIILISTVLYSCIDKNFKELDLKQFKEDKDLTFIDSLNIVESKCFSIPSIDDLCGCVISVEQNQVSFIENMITYGFESKKCNIESSLKEMIIDKIPEIMELRNEIKDSEKNCFELKRNNSERKSDVIEMEYYLESNKILLFYSER